jgi:ribosomal protein S18 acetylase RimI-like enzyme
MKENSLENKDPKIEIAVPIIDWEAYRNIRLDALTKYPEAFGSTLKEAMTKTNQEWMAELSNDKRFTVLAKIDSSMFGAKSIASAKDKGEGIWHIIGVYTRPNFLRRGIAEKVVTKVLEEIKRRGGNTATLNVMRGEKQEAARKMYQKMGFTELKAKLGAGSYFMGKDLIDQSKK